MISHLAGLALMTSAVQAEPASAPVPAPAPAVAAAPQVPASVLVPQGTGLIMSTQVSLSSKTTQKGTQVPLKVEEDVLVDGKLVIPAGTAAVGIVTDAYDTGGLGTNGKLQLAPLYLSIGGETVRLTGGDLYNGKTKADTVVGMAFTGLISGRKAVVPAGTRLGARVLRDIRLPLASP